MNGLIRYDSMCRAIDEAYEIDEVKNIRDQAIALEHYARQANNVVAEQRCCRIRLRAERKSNHLYDAQQKAEGTKGQLKGRDSSGRRVIGPPDNHAKTLSDYNITKQQMSEWRKLGRLPEDRFEEAVEILDRPSIDAVVDYVNGEPKPSPVSSEALWLWGRLRDFTRHGLLEMTAADVLSTMTPAMRQDVKGCITAVIDWLTTVEDSP